MIKEYFHKFKSYLLDEFIKKTDSDLATLLSRLNHIDMIVNEKIMSSEKVSSTSIYATQVHLEEKIDFLNSSESARFEKLEAQIKQLVEKIDTEKESLHHHLHNLKQTAALAVKKRDEKLQIRCIFLVHSSEAWSTYHDIYLAMLLDLRFNPIVISINRRYPGEIEFLHEAETSQFLTEMGISHLRFTMTNSWEGLDILKSLAPDIIFRQSQWEPDIPPAFHTAELTFARICYMSYGSVLVDSFEASDQKTNNELGFNQYFHKLAWRIYCESKETQSIFESNLIGDSAKYKLIGALKVKKLLSEQEFWPLMNFTTSKKVIWAPHHSKSGEWLGFGVFEEVYIKMLMFVRSHPDVSFVLRPHPALFSNLVAQSRMSKKDLDLWIEDWCACTNTALYTGGSYGGLFRASDLLLTDGVSWLMEYPLFDKPVLFLDNQQHVNFNQLGVLSVSCCESLNLKSESFEEKLEKMLLEPDVYVKTDNVTKLKCELNLSSASALLVLDDIADGIFN